MGRCTVLFAAAPCPCRSRATVAQARLRQGWSFTAGVCPRRRRFHRAPLPLDSARGELRHRGARSSSAVRPARRPVRHRERTRRRNAFGAHDGPARERRDRHRRGGRASAGDAGGSARRPRRDSGCGARVGRPRIRARRRRRARHRTGRARRHRDGAPRRAREARPVAAPRIHRRPARCEDPRAHDGRDDPDPRDREDGRPRA